MGRKVKTRLTAEQRRERAEELQGSIAEQVEALRDSKQWQRFLDFAQSFHSYSINNVMLILSQKADATRVAGFRKWQQHNRQVRKGERALKIFGFAQKKVADEDAEDGEKTVTYFPILSVFDIGQTEPIDPEVDDPSTIAHRLTGDDPLGVVEAVSDFLTSEGWTLNREPIAGPANGYTTTDGTQRVVVDADLSPAQAAKTALHEAAHVILHSDEDYAEYVQHRGLKETEAESVAYVVAGLLGLDTSAYSIGYVAGWSHGDLDLIKTTAANVLTAAHRLIEAIAD